MKIRTAVLVLLLSGACAFGQWTAYLGNLHSHTSNSDGTGTPAEAFDYARNVAQIDFLAVTDHLEQIYYLPWRWSEVKNAANSATVNGVFIGIAGYEWSCPLTNHVNVFNTPNMVTPLTYFDFPEFCEDLLDESPAFAQFNHPGREELALDWDNFAYVSPAVDSAFALIEVREFYQDSFYQMALDSGWHVSPVSNQDNHDANWGNKNDSRAGIWATELTREALFEAIVAGRTFSTLDKNSYIWIRLDSIPMGSRTTRRSSMRLFIHLQDLDGEAWSTIEVKASSGRTLATLPPRTTSLDTAFAIFPTDEKWLFVRACQHDDQWIWSAPIYLEGMPLSIGEDERLPAINTISAFPNPFNSAVKITIDCAGANFTPAHADIFDVNGRVVDVVAIKATLDNAPFDKLRTLPRNDSGYEFIWQPAPCVKSGVYFARVGDNSAVSRLLYLK